MCEPPPKWDQGGDVPVEKVWEREGVSPKWDLDVSPKRGAGRRRAPSPNRGWEGGVIPPNQTEGICHPQKGVRRRRAP